MEGKYAIFKIGEETYGIRIVQKQLRYRTSVVFVL